MANTTVLTVISDPGQSIVYNTSPIINNSPNTTDAYSVTSDTTVRFGAAFEATASGSAFSLTTDSTSTIIYGFFPQASGSQAFQGQIGGTHSGFNNAIVTTNGTLQFRGFTDAGQFTQLITNAGGTVDFSGTSGYSKDNTVYAESIAGAGTYELGSNALYVGSSGLTLSTEVSGSIEDGGFSGGSGASLHYEGLTGSNTLILSGNNTYTGGTFINDGILQLGNGGASGSILGNVSLNNSFMVFDRSGTYTYGGNISGIAALQQIGSGVTILTGANSYDFGSTITAGTLQLGNGGASGSIIGNVTDNATFAIDHSDAVTFAGAISGTGAFEQLGSGTTIFTAADSYGGGTTISAGTLQLGGGGTSGSIVGDVTDNAAFAIDHSDIVTFDATISGTGAFEQLGSGTTIFTAADSYGGGTTIAAGTLQLGSGGTSGSIVGDVADNATFAIDHSDNVTFTGTISGTGAFEQLGSGTTIFTATDSYGGGTTIAAGALQLGSGGTSGSIVGEVTIDDGATFAIDRSDTYTFAGTISGNGAFQQIGTGTTILTAAETYTGGTTVSAGTLRLGNGGSFVAAGALSIDGGAVDLNGHSQVLGDLSGTGGLLALGGAVLTVGTADSTMFSGAITGPGLVVKTGTGTLTLAGANSYTGGTVIEDGTLQLGDGGTTGSLTGAILDDGVLAIDRSDVVTVGNTIVSTGAVEVTGTGTVILTAVNAYGGGTTISAGTLELANANAAGSGAITFVNDSVLKIDGTTMPTNTIDGFATGDTIDLTGIGNLAGSHADMDYATNVLTVTEGGKTHTLQFAPTAKFAGEYFHLAGDGANGTQITENQVACYCRGTLIAAEHGDVPVERLVIGDDVMTASGALRPIKWIGRRSYGGRFIMGRKDILPICFKAGSLGDNMPMRDLWISPHHAMYFENEGDGALIEAKDLVNGVSIVQAEQVDEVEYFHIELETHDVIVAEGALSETFVDDDSRGMFHNVHEYSALYADEGMTPARYCAPRLDQGYELEAVRRRLARQAGLLPAAGRPGAGALRGYVDLVSAGCIAGWVQNIDHAEAPVCLDIVAGGQLIGQVLANRYRDDLERAGVGSGRHSFEFTPPAGLAFTPGAVEVRRSLDGAALKLSMDALWERPQSTIQSVALLPDQGISRSKSAGAR